MQFWDLNFQAISTHCNFYFTVSFICQSGCSNKSHICNRRPSKRLFLFSDAFVFRSLAFKWAINKIEIYLMALETYCISPDEMFLGNKLFFTFAMSSVSINVVLNCLKAKMWHKKHFSLLTFFCSFLSWKEIVLIVRVEIRKSIELKHVLWINLWNYIIRWNALKVFY